MILPRLRSLAIALVMPLALPVLWWFATAGSTSPFYPSLETILVSFRDTWLFSHVGSDAIPSLERFFFGYLLAIALGVGLGVLFGRLRLLDAAFQPAIQFSRSIPATALVPVSITLLGIGSTPKISLIAFVCLFPVLLNTIDGVRSIEPGLEDVGRTFRLTRLQRIFSIQLPSAAPQIFVGMRLALAIAFIMMIVTEMVGASSGIGYVTLNAQQSFDVPVMWAGMVLLGILGAGLNAVFMALERRLLHWRYASTGR